MAETVLTSEIVFGIGQSTTFNVLFSLGNPWKPHVQEMTPDFGKIHIFLASMSKVLATTFPVLASVSGDAPRNLMQK